MNDIQTMIVDIVTRATATANGIAQEVANATGNVNKQIRDLRTDENTDDDNVKKFQEHLAKLDAAREAAITQVNEYLAKKIGVKEMTDEEREAKREAYKAAKDELTSALNLAKTQGATDEWFADVPALLNFSGRKSGAQSGGTGIRRPRIAEITVDGEPLKTSEGKTSFSLLAAHLTDLGSDKVATSDLHAAAFEAAGTEDLSTVTDVEFNYSTTSDGVTTDHAIRMVPVDSEKKNSTETPAAE